MSSTDIDILVHHIKKIKLNALVELKDKINSSITINTKKAIEDIKTIDNGITASEAIQEFYTSRESTVQTKAFTQSKRDVDIFLEFCNISNLEYINLLKNKDLIDFRNYLKKIKPNRKTSTLNNIITNILTFINYCHEQAHYIANKITKGVKVPQTIQDKVNTVKPWTDTDINKLFTNIKLLTHTKGNIPKSYQYEYPMIIKIAMFTGARENEIIQLTKKDIQTSQDAILYINITIDDTKSIKNITSIRKVPVHKDLEEDLLNYIKTKSNKLFTINTANFAKQFSYFKASLKFPKTIKVFHSFRHSLQDKLKQQLVEGMVINELTGHSQTKDNKMQITIQISIIYLFYYKS